MLALRTRRAAPPGGRVLPRRAAATASGSVRRSRSSAAAGCATMCARVTQDLAHRFEELIRAAPEQWLMMQPNWPSDWPDGTDVGA